MAFSSGAVLAGIGSAIKTRIEVIRDVDAALREGRIDAFYQPILRLDTRAIVGMEALCRLRKPDGEIVSAAAFHHATSDVSVASNLTERMMATVSADARLAGPGHSAATYWHQHFFSRL
nr:EAL domain-containing protein [Mesorhizobium sp. B2-3-4]